MSLWTQRADALQGSVEALFGAPRPQMLHNTYPFEEGDDATFNYWWLAHLMDARIDAFERTGDEQWLEQAAAVFDNIVERNDGSMFNDYFDDMLWFALAAQRLGQASGEERFTQAAVQLWDHIVKFGWNDIQGESLAWRKQQLYYKNTPANGPLVILGARLHRLTGDQRFLSTALRSFEWLGATLVGPDGFVEDGINRTEDGTVDTQWRFTYNQGLYVGAALELAHTLGQEDLVEVATRTSLVAIDELGDGRTFRSEGPDGDEGLFKGVYYRYVSLLLDSIEPSSAHARKLSEFIDASTDSLWEITLAERPDTLQAGDDWAQSGQAKTYLSTQLSAIMATEVRARREQERLTSL